jgi:hypothetical protein
LKRLEHLQLWGTPVDDAGVAHLPPLESLTCLNLRWTKATSKCMLHLKHLTNLERLHLDTYLPSDLLELMRHAPKCRVEW